ncbi:hypothetical protein BGZ95_003681 [Linnemannia exigua]|uniref:RNI-like protein n=1 Tax=Linnemannia exigua TaxID=604196 RepID=A0AAD4H2K9_9FUNG|nr:hypothetical protein BGZ95_003681 [Linnemannia exigua]
MLSSEEKNMLEQSTAHYGNYVGAMKNGQKKHDDLIRGDFSELQASFDRNHDLQQQLNNMQQCMPQMQQQALDRLTVIQGRIQAILTQTYNLHEYSNPRLFIILPMDTSDGNPVNLLNNQFKLHFLCECGEHTKALNDDNTNIPHHIHIAKHEGYDLQRPAEFFRKYGRYMLTLLEMIKHGSTVAGYFVPALSPINVPSTIDMIANSQDTVNPSAIERSIEYLQSLSSNQDAAADNGADSFAGREALELSDLRHLEVFIKSKDQDRALGNLYRTITEDGHVKWVCIDHHRLAYKKQDQQAFITTVQVNGGHYDPHLDRATVSLESKILAAEFFDVLVKARRVDELVVSFDWEGTMSDLEAFGDTLKGTTISILRLDLQQFGRILTNEPQSTYTGQQALANVINLSSMKMVHIVLPMDLVELSALQSKMLSFPPKVSFEVVSRLGGGEAFEERSLKKLADILKTDSTLITLDLSHTSIGEKNVVTLSKALETNSAPNSALASLALYKNPIGNDESVGPLEILKTTPTPTPLNFRSFPIRHSKAVTLSKALKINSTLTSLNLSCTSIGNYEAATLSDALKANSTLTSLDLWANSIRDGGAVALSEALKTNSTLTFLNLSNNSIGNSGAVALSRALKTNSTLTTLSLYKNSIGDNGAVALSDALKTNSTLASLNLSNNSIRDNGAVALTEALEINSTLSILDLSYNSIRDKGGVALSEALKANSTLTSLNLSNNSIKVNGSVALSEALKTNSTLASLHLYKNSIGYSGAEALSEALKINSTVRVTR